MAIANLTLARLLEVLEYFSATGVFVWRVTTARRIKVGDVAGTLTPDGYILIQVDGRRYLAHRLAWFYQTGKWPTNQIDHIDGNRATNRWDNLREATHAENQHNQRKAQRHNLSSGLLGATWHRRAGKWAARISFNGKKRHLGLFPTAELAHAAYVAEKRKLHSFGMI